MPTYPHIERYHADKQRFIEFGGSDNEDNIRRAFAVCLDSYCREHREKLALVDELEARLHNRPDGTVKDSLRMDRGHWEAKDTHDDLDTEIQHKFNRGYPQDNILSTMTSISGCGWARSCSTCTSVSSPPIRTPFSGTTRLAPRLE